MLEAFREAASAGIPSFFDPGPGNPTLDNDWHKEVVQLSHVVLANEKEAVRLTGATDALSSGPGLHRRGVKLAVVKRDVAGCLLVTKDQFEIAPGYPVPVVDATGAGDSLAAGIIFGHLNGLSLATLGVLANAIGAAKVQKRGTGLNVPTRGEVHAVLQRFSEDPSLLDSAGGRTPSARRDQGRGCAPAWGRSPRLVFYSQSILPAPGDHDDCRGRVPLEVDALVVEGCPGEELTPSLFIPVVHVRAKHSESQRLLAARNGWVIAAGQQRAVRPEQAEAGSQETQRRRAREHVEEGER